MKELTLANKITIFRICLVPIIILISIITELNSELYNHICIVLIVIFGLGDALDGYISRKYNQVTKLGSFLDPFADKYMVLSVCMILAYYKKMPLWYLLIIFNKDLFVLAAWLLLFLKIKDVYVRPNIFGKSSMLSQQIVILMAFLDLQTPLYMYILLVSAGLNIAACVTYIQAGLNYYKEAKLEIEI